MIKKRAFIQCDVFSGIATKGNALAVVLDGEGLSDDKMASFAAWTNLAETTFLLPPKDPAADYTLRIFTPQREMLFAGHPTLGSCAAWLHQGGMSKEPGVVRQECGIGLVEIDARKDTLAFVAPPTRMTAMSTAVRDRIARKLMLSTDQIINAVVLNNGPEWHVFQLPSAKHVLAVDANQVRWPDEAGIGLIGAHPEGSECAYEVRMLAPSSGMLEDPITGSLNAALAHWLNSQKLLHQHITIAQGTCLDRHGRVYISKNEDRLLIGGQTHILIEGTVLL